MQGRAESEEKLAENIFPFGLEIMLMIFMQLGDGNAGVKPRFGSGNRDQRAWNCTGKFFHQAALTATIPTLAVKYYWANAPAVQRLFNENTIQTTFYFLNSRLNLISFYIDLTVNDLDLYCLTGQVELIEKVITRQTLLAVSEKDKAVSLHQRYLFFIALSENAVALQHYVNHFKLTPDDIAPLNTEAKIEQFLFCLCLMGTQAAWRATEAIVTKERIKEFLLKAKVIASINNYLTSSDVMTPESIGCLLDYCDAAAHQLELNKLCECLRALNKLDLLGSFRRHEKKNAAYQFPIHTYHFPDDVDKLLQPDFVYTDTVISYLVSMTDSVLQLDVLQKIFQAIAQSKVSTNVGKDILLKLMTTGKLSPFKQLMQDEFCRALVYENEHECGHRLLEGVLSHAMKNKDIEVEALQYLLHDLKINWQSKHNADNRLTFAAAISTTELLTEFLRLKPKLDVTRQNKTLWSHMFCRYKENLIPSAQLTLNVILLIQSGLNLRQILGDADAKYYNDNMCWRMCPLTRSGHFGKFVLAVMAAGGWIHKTDKSGCSLFSLALDNTDCVKVFGEEKLCSILKDGEDESLRINKSCINKLFLNACVQGASSLLELLLERGVNLMDSIYMIKEIFRKSIRDAAHLARFDMYFAPHNHSRRSEGFTGLDLAIAGNHVEAVRVIVNHFDANQLHSLCTDPHLFSSVNTYDFAVAMGNHDIIAMLEPFRMTPEARNRL